VSITIWVGGTENQVLASVVTIWIGGHRNGGKDGIKVFGKEVIKHADYVQLKHWQVIHSITNLNIRSKRNQSFPTNHQLDMDYFGMIGNYV